MVWLARNLKLEVTQNSMDLYDHRGLVYPDNDDDDDDDDDDDINGDAEEELEVTSSYYPWKRHFR